MPRSDNKVKISQSYILTLHNPEGNLISVKCEQHLDKLTIEVWLLYPQPNLLGCIYEQMDRWMIQTIEWTF